MSVKPEMAQRGPRTENAVVLHLMVARPYMVGAKGFMLRLPMPDRAHAFKALLRMSFRLVRHMRVVQRRL